MCPRAHLACLCALAGCASENPTATPPSEASERVIVLPDGVEVDRVEGEVRIPARVAIDVGWIEQVVCVQGSRDHESLLVVTALPSNVHAALLLLGLEPGHPGNWQFVQADGKTPEIERIAAEGDPVAISVRMIDADGNARTWPLAEWLLGMPGERKFPEQPWIFGGSVLLDDGAYAADQSGSLVGLVTFGDEVLGLETILADQVGVDAAEWEALTEAIPPPGTEVILVLRPWSREP